MRGIKLLHVAFPITWIIDSGVYGTTTDSPEYQEYMNLRRSVKSQDVEVGAVGNCGDTKVIFMNSKSPDSSDANAQSIVLKLEHSGGGSCMIVGDTDFRPWKEKILPNYGEYMKSDILLAAHHGSIKFFGDTSNPQSYYLDHIKAIAPSMTIISVGPNNFGLPDKEAIQLYEEYSKGSDEGMKIATTQDKGNIRLDMKENGRWRLNFQQ